MIIGKLAGDIPSALGKLSNIVKVPSNIGNMPPSTIPYATTGPTGPTSMQTNFPTMGLGTNDGENSFSTGIFILKKYF